MRHALIVLALVLVPSWAWGQGTVLNPQRAQFTASPDHQTLVRYELRVYRVGDTVPVRTEDLGKPTPDGTNTITVPFAPFPQDPGVVYVATVIAIDAQGQAPSLPSNDFLFGQGAELAPTQKVKANWNAFGAAGTPVPWPANQPVTWTVNNAGGAFEVVQGEPAAWFLPAKAGTFVVETSTVWNAQTYLFKLAFVVK